MFRRVLLLTTLVLTFARLVSSAQDCKTGNCRITNKQIESVLQAIRDEIYDYRYYKEFWGFETAGPNGPWAEFNVYINPQLKSSNGGDEGVVIYKYLPFGEVIRPFIVDSGGNAYLTGSPDRGFGWTRPEGNTIYMDDEEVIKDKQQSIKVPFSIELKPSRKLILEAAARQKMRTGSSKWELKHPNKTN
jgi:hypothetical protein